jgi:protoporphyrinogen oxidase
VSLSVLATLITPSFFKKTVSYEDYCRSIFGNKIYEIVFRPLAEKTWGNPKNLTANIAKRRIPTKNIYDLIFRLLKIKKESKLTNAEFILYPYLGFYDICESIAKRIGKLGFTINLIRKPTRFVIKDKKIKTIVFDDYKEEECDLVISSIPLDELITLLFPQEKNLSEQGNFFQMRHSIIVYLLINKPGVLDDHWIFCADKELIFSRISEQKLLSDFCFPKDKTVVCCDFTCDEENPNWRALDKTITERCIWGLEKLGLIKKEEVIDSCLVRIPHFYPCDELGFEKKRKLLFEKINRIENVICIGRLGMSEYCNVDHCLDMAIFIANALAAGKEPPGINYGLIERTQTYRIVD